jgi:hypothetical protein
MRRSDDAAISHGIAISRAAAAKNRRARRASSPAARHRRRASASRAATVMPWPKMGLKLQMASPKTSSPSGKERMRSYRRQELAWYLKVRASPTGVSPTRALPSSGDGRLSAKARKPSRSGGAASPR